VSAAGPTDPDVDILMLRDVATHQPFAGITIFAMHSDTVGGTAFSADYEYYVQQTLQAAFGTNFISAFGLGACGDINHINVNRKEPTSGFAVAQRLGDALGHTVLEAAPELQVIEHPSFAARSRTLKIALQRPGAADFTNAQNMVERLGDPKTDFLTRVAAVKVLDLAARGLTWPMEVQVLRIDSETALVCLPGEIFAQLGLAIKRGSPFKHTFVMSICNDRPSYVPTRQAFAEGSYEVMNSRVQAGTGEELVEAALTLLKEL
jgi:hypothetical protein